MSLVPLLPQAELSQRLGILQRRVHRGVKDLYTISHSLLALGVSEQQVRWCLHPQGLQLDALFPYPQGLQHAVFLWVRRFAACCVAV